MEEEPKYSVTENCSLETSKMIFSVAVEESSTPMEKHTQENGKQVNVTAKEHTTTLTAQNTKAIGKTTSEMEMVEKR